MSFSGSCGHTVLREHEKRPARSIAGFGATEGPFLFTMGMSIVNMSVSLVVDE
jgi:hypothetical protein